METNNTTTPKTNEDSMITQLFQQFIENGGTPKVTEFKKHLNELINSDIKHLCGRSGKSADGNDWRSVLKAQFSGRGAKWVQVPTDSVLPTLDRLDAEGFTTEAYRTHINNAGFAFIRFAGPRIAYDNIQAAAFEVRTNGSTFDHPKQLHYIAIHDLDDKIESLPATPHAMKLEFATTRMEEVEVDEPVIEVEEDYEDLMGNIEDLMEMEDEEL